MVPVKYNIKKRKQTISVFRGINQGVNTSMSRVNSKNSSLYMEFKNIKNVTLDDYPTIRTRNKRQFLGKKNVMYDSAIISNILPSSFGVVYLENSGRLYFGNSSCELFKPENSDENKEIIRTLYEFGNSVLVMPDKVLISPIITDKNVNFSKKNIERYFESAGSENSYIRKVALNTSIEPRQHYIQNVSVNLSDREMQRIDAEHDYKELFSKLQLGDVIESTNTSPSTLYMVTEIKSGDEFSEYIDSRVIVLTIMYGTYTRIERRGIGIGFAVDDWVRISDVTEVYNLNSSFKIIDKSDDFIVINCETDRTMEYLGAITIERKMPANLDFLVSINNRMWGCSSIDNRIYASKLGDVTNWEAYGDGISTDSYWVDVSTSGEFTGATANSNAIYFFKENCIHRIIGTKPRNFTATVFEDLGVRKGSDKSIVWIRDRLFYHSPVGVCVYSPGGEPIVISACAFGNNRYAEAVAGRHRDKYYISIINTNNGQSELYVYDLSSSQWLKEDNLRFTSSATYNNLMYFANTNTGYIGCIEAEQGNLLVKTFEENDINYNNNAIGELVEGTEITLGDINGDGIVTLDDAVQLQILLADASGLEGLSETERQRIQVAGDINEDGIVDINDVTYLQKWVDVPELYNENDVEFMLESGDLYNYYTNKKYIQKVELCAEVNSGAKVAIAISCDNKPFEEIKTLYADRKKQINIPLHPGRCDSFRIRIYGYGDFVLYNLTLTTEEGGR